MFFQLLGDEQGDSARAVAFDLDGEVATELGLGHEGGHAVGER
jgi:hypothetical protein